MTSKPFRARPAARADFDKTLRYRGAMSGVIDPGTIAAEVLGPEVSFGRLFAYCFRRFGNPNCAADPDKDIAQYRLTTPMRDVFLTVSIKAAADTHLLFGYLVAEDMDHQMGIEARRSNLKFHADFRAWRFSTGNLLPRDRKEDEDPSGSQFNKVLRQYCAAGGTHYKRMPLGRTTTAVLAALRATIADLRSPVAVRDQYFSVISDECDELKNAAPRYAGAGYWVPPELMSNPDRYVAFIDRLEALGGGDLSRGIEKFLDAGTEQAPVPRRARRPR